MKSNLLSADTVKIIQYYFCVVIPALTKNMFDFFLLVDCMRTTIFIFLYGLQIEWSWGARDISGNSKVNLQLNLLTWNPIFCYMFDPSSSLLLSRWKEDISKGMNIHTWIESIWIYAQIASWILSASAIGKSCLLQAPDTDQQCGVISMKSFC